MSAQRGNWIDGERSAWGLRSESSFLTLSQQMQSLENFSSYKVKCHPSQEKEKIVKQESRMRLLALVSTSCQLRAFHSKLRRGKIAYAAT